MATMAEALADIEDEIDDLDESFCVLDDDPGSGIQVSWRRVMDFLALCLVLYYGIELSGGQDLFVSVH